MTKDEIELLAEGLAEVALGGNKKPDKIVAGFSCLLNAIVRLEARVAEIETRGVQYRGVFQSAQQYARGDLVTFDGSIYHANADTRCKPGNGSTDWTLAVKRGCDGKDAERRRNPTGVRR